jgi:hypothetical protein
MGTTRQRCEPGVDEQGSYRLSVKPGARSTDFATVWQRNCAVIRELEMTAAELEAVRDCHE